MTWLVVLPVALPLLGAAVAVVCWRQAELQRWLALASIAGMLAAALPLLDAAWRLGPQVMQMGGWPAPFGISFAADVLGSGMTVLAAVVGLAVAVFAAADAARAGEADGFYPLLLVLLAGVAGGFLTGDIFNLYVWFEVMLISAFGLLVLGGGARRIDGAVKYAAVNLVGTTLFLVATGLLYGVTGTLNMADLPGKVAAASPETPLGAIAMLYLVSVGMKAAAFPLFFWLPASYHTPAVAVSAVLAGLLTKVGVYVLIRIFTLVLAGRDGGAAELLPVVAAGTMLAGAIGALAQTDLRRLLSFNLVSGIGFILLGLALGSEFGLLGAIFYTAHHILVVTALFLAGGLVQRIGGSDHLDRLGGIYRASPVLAACFLICGLSLAGLPPFSGFWAKLFLVRASLDLGHSALAGIALASGLLTTITIGKAWGEAFWRPAASGRTIEAPSGRAALLLLGPIAVLTLISLLIGLWASPLVEVAARAAGELAAPQGYIDAVLGGRP